MRSRKVHGRLLPACAVGLMAMYAGCDLNPQPLPPTPETVGPGSGHIGADAAVSGASSGGGILAPPAGSGGAGSFPYRDAGVMSADASSGPDVVGDSGEDGASDGSAGMAPPDAWIESGDAPEDSVEDDMQVCPEGSE